MMAAAMRPISANATETNAAPLPSSTERIWTIDGRKYQGMHYLGPFEKNGMKYVVLAPNGLGPMTIPFDKLSPEDIEVINEYDRIRQLNKDENN